MKSFNLFGLTVFCTLLLLSTSCGFDTDRGDDGGASGEGDNAVEESTHDYTALKEFSRTAFSHGMMEVELAQVAIERSDHVGVRKLAKSIKNDHEKANDNLRKITSNYNWDIDAEMMEKHEQMVEKLKDVPKEEINKAFLDMMVSTHRDAIKKFTNVLNQEYDEERIAARDGDKLNLNQDSGNQRNTQDTTIMSPPENEPTPPTMGSKSSNVEEDDHTGDYDDAPTDTAPGNIPNREKAYSVYKEEGAEDAGTKGETTAAYADNVKAPQLKHWVVNTLPALNRHLDESLEMQKKLNTAQ